MGSVENGDEFKKTCAEINCLPGNVVAGIDVNYAAPGRQQQNVAERHIQSFDKKQNAILIAQDLLGPSFWQLAGRATAITINGTYNSLLSNATPMIVFQG